MENKITCILSFGSQGTFVELNAQSAVVNCNIVTPSIDDLEKCSDADGFSKLKAPDNDTLVTFKGSALFVPAPWLRNFILNLDLMESFEMIPAALAAGIEFNGIH